MKPHTIILATLNSGKIRELNELLNKFNISVTGLEKWPQLHDIPETGSTFEENALIKARAAAKATGQIAIADDSGLVIDSLAGKPGVYSARYSNDWDSLPGETKDERNIRKLLWEMKDIPLERRTAHFETAMAAVAPNGLEMTASGQWHGQIALARAGSNGFGYDPVFYDPILKKHAAELTREQKNNVSHRGKALASLLTNWNDFMEAVTKKEAERQ